MFNLACSHKVLKSQKVRAAFIKLSLYSEKQNERLVGDHDSAKGKQGSRRGFWRFLFFLSPMPLPAGPQNGGQSRLSPPGVGRQKIGWYGRGVREFLCNYSARGRREFGGKPVACCVLTAQRNIATQRTCQPLRTFSVEGGENNGKARSRRAGFRLHGAFNFDERKSC